VAVATNPHPRFFFQKVAPCPFGSVVYVLRWPDMATLAGGVFLKVVFALFAVNA
jgi:hypothetical protein